MNATVLCCHYNSFPIKPRRGDTIIVIIMTKSSKPRRGEIIIVIIMTKSSKPRRGDSILLNKIMD